MLNGFATIVAFYRQQFEADTMIFSFKVPVASREVSVDAASYRFALGTHPDRFGYQQIAVGLNLDIAVIRLDVFNCRNRG